MEKIKFRSKTGIVLVVMIMALGGIINSNWSNRFIRVSLNGALVDDLIIKDN